MIDNFTYNTPTKLIFGKGVIKDLPEVIIKNLTPQFQYSFCTVLQSVQFVFPKIAHFFEVCNFY